MLIQVLILSSNKVGSGRLTLESYFDARLNSNSGNWPLPSFDSTAFASESLARDTRYRENAAFTIASQWNGTFDFWQPVRTSSHKFWIFSAYVDTYKRSNLNRLKSYTDDDDAMYFVRVIAATELNSKENILCCYDLPATQSQNVSRDSTCREGSSKAIREHWGLKYSAFFLYCPLPRNWRWRPEGVPSLSILALTSDPNLFLRENVKMLQLLVPSNRLTVHTETDQLFRPDDQSLAVCIKPLHYFFNKSLALVEFIELNRLLGVRHFYFYNHTVGKDVNLILRNLASRESSLITILPWLLPIKSQKEIRTEGIFAALNDCLYRARKDHYRYVLFIDLDEYILPQRHRTLSEMINALGAIYGTEPLGAFSFRNAFFYLQYPNEPIQLEEEFNPKPPQVKRLVRQLMTLSKTRRKAHLNMHKQRSKCIIIPEYTIEMGNHFVWQMTPGKRTLNVNPEIGKVNHYRAECEFGGTECVQETVPAITDRRMAEWAPGLLAAVEVHLRSLCASWPRRLSQMCQLVGK